jgi:probable phosphoglycerate mutase
MKIYVVRHGATELNKKELVNGWIDEPLCEEGILQAEKLRDELPDDIKVIYSSALQRARQTADIINQRFHVPISYHDELKERNWGTLSGKRFEDIENEHGPEYSKAKDFRLEYDYRAFGGESIEEVRNRVHKIMDEIKSSHSDGPVLLVAHGGILRILNHDYNHQLMETMPNAHVVEIDI